jgi:predicted transcriptional regulator
MKSISIELDTQTIGKMADLAQHWEMSDTRYNTPVVMRCVERVYWQEIPDRRDSKPLYIAESETAYEHETKQKGVTLDGETIKQMQELAELWDLPDVRHSTAVISECVHRVWNQAIGVDNRR